MANPNLINGFDTNETNIGELTNTLKNDGYSTLEILESKHLNYILNQLFSAANKNKNDGVWDWEDPTALDATTEYNIGSIVRYSGEIFIQN